MPAIRDPVHSWIKCSTEEQQIIDSPLFQRLHWVSQLNSVKQVFPGGVHTRFLHSLGVMELSGQYMTHLLSDKISSHSQLPVHITVMKDYYIQLARLAGLLHDIGHGPFSHAFDRAIYQQLYDVRDGGHDFHRLIMVQSDFLRPLIEGCGIQVDHLIATWSKNSKQYQQANKEMQNMFDIIRAVVGGPLGGDRMDFTLRDSYFTGTSHLGTIASSRIITNSSLRTVRTRATSTDSDSSDFGKNEVNNCRLYLHYHFKCLSDIIQALSGRYYMYDSVYLHKTSGAANVLIEQMLSKSAKYLNTVERTQDLEQFQWLNDSTTIGEIMAYRGQDQDMLEAQQACKDLLQRRLPKLRFETIVEAGEEFYDHDPEYYLNKFSDQLVNLPTTDLVVKRTRSIRGIDPVKFDKHQLKFWDSSQNISMTCEQALEKIKYTCPQDPYYLVRIYQLNRHGPL